LVVVKQTQEQMFGANVLEVQALSFLARHLKRPTHAVGKVVPVHGQ